VTHETSRKRFLTKVLGLVTVGALAPRAVTKAMMPELGAKPARKTAAFTLKTQDRAVSRSERA
jgi:hypothetical protein